MKSRGAPNIAPGFINLMRHDSARAIQNHAAPYQRGHILARGRKNRSDKTFEKVQEIFQKTGPIKKTEVIYLAHSKDGRYAEKWTREMRAPIEILHRKPFCKRKSSPK